MMNTLSVSETEPASRRRSRWYQFRVRTLLFATAVLALCLGLGVRAWQRHRALEVIRHEMQGGVIHSYLYTGETGGSRGHCETEPGPDWLRQSMGEDLFDDTFYDVRAIFVGDFVIRPFLPRRSKDARSSIDDAGLRRLREVLPLFDDLEYLAVMTSSKVTDAGLEHLAGVPQLQQLDASESRITGTGLRHLDAASLKDLNLRGTSLGDDLACLHPFTQLQILDLGETDLTDAGLRHLASQSNLERLCLDNTRISDDGLKHLRGMKSLELLILSHTEVTDGAFDHLKDLPAVRILIASNTQIVGSGLKRCLEMPNLEDLSLSHTPIRSEFLADLKGQSSLEYLNLSDTRITDAGLVFLKDLPALEGLLVAGTDVTNVGLRHLMEVKRLDWLSLERTKVTDGGVEELRRAYPDCQIDF